MTRQLQKDVLYTRMRNAMNGVTQYMPGRSASLDRDQIRAKFANFAALLDEMRCVRLNAQSEDYRSIFDMDSIDSLFYFCRRMASVWLAAIDCIAISDVDSVSQDFLDLRDILLQIRDF